ncbi:NAD(P)/FAD-dependent oxidoreductase [Ferruginibacter lapsinanis]|uniref:NAD(P)/FAD-dependent oxidoreductase n=1 Tax=Ferruginibacter lapsinanis TaxID=563172 RepID=UPI001E47BF07|nr:NAD(P)/FAD-dependent oxidoreductase [Ferruginibacter lapsinanis]UEG49961.1 NAD(P)/FAD-dependent oxidoreductase [Ferruginibacter lapsinanis]
MTKKRLIVIGGGAAGFFCAVNAARLNNALEVVIIEKTSKLLSKVKVSGGGRCNVTHHCFSIAEMVKKYPRGESFLKKAFHHFFTKDTIEWFNERGVKLKTEADGRMFPATDSSQTIIDCLMREVNKYGVEILMNREVKQLTKSNGQWIVDFGNDKVEQADYVCIASGGYPKAMQFDWLKKMGNTIQDPAPSLFTFNMPGNAITELMGITVERVSVKIIGTKLSESGPLLITHWGMSGPAILKLSAWGAKELAICNYQFAILINWLPDFNENSLREKFQQIRFDIAAQKIVNRNPFGLPQRLWQYLLQQSGINEDMRWADLPAKEQNKLIKNLCAQEFAVSGKTTFKEEFVTAGGITLSEIDHNTMQSKIEPNLFFAGEVIDVDGVTGGFNFQNAWTTGFIAAKAIANSASS